MPSEAGCAEVQEQAKRQSHQPKIGEQLLHMDWSRALGGLQFYKQAVLEEQVGYECAAEVAAFIANVDRQLPIDPDTSSCQLVRKERFVDTFHQAWPKVAMKMESGIDHGFGKLLDLREVEGLPLP
jgi:hypothetical protein